MARRFTHGGRVETRDPGPYLDGRVIFSEEHRRRVRVEEDETGEGFGCTVGELLDDNPGDTEAAREVRDAILLLLRHRADEAYIGGGAAGLTVIRLIDEGGR
jgi:hypothetical protein